MVSIPQFTMGGHIRDDWMQGAEGISNALGQYHQRGLQNRKIEQDQRQFEAQNLLARNQFGELQRQHGVTNALARDQFGEFKRQHDATNLLARDKFGLEQTKSPYEEDLLQAQAEAQRAHGGYYNARAGEAKALADARNAADQQPSPTQGLRQREDGTLYDAGTEGGVSLDQGAGGVDVSEGAVRFGARGLMPRDVPGVVVTPRGVSDRFATEQARGQEAIDAHPDAQRINRFTKTQERWTRGYGVRPRAGYMYDEQGREVAKGPMSNAADTAERKDRAIGNMMLQIDAAEATLIGKARPDGTRDNSGSSNLSRSVAAGLDELGPIGRFVQPRSMEQLNAAFGQYQEGVMQTVYALSGKMTTNKEMESFLRLYMPRSGESDERIAEKTGRLKRMLGTLRSATKRGMIYEDAERAALAEATGADTTRQQPAASPGGAGPAAGPAAAQPEATPGVKKYRNKYQELE
tara:strand:+ start:74 stop:1465 length:1392 start_codon:yes stop_codon:yes gene_type:complete